MGTNALPGRGASTIALAAGDRDRQNLDESAHTLVGRCRTAEEIALRPEPDVTGVITELDQSLNLLVWLDTLGDDGEIKCLGHVEHRCDDGIGPTIGSESTDERLIDLDPGDGEGLKIGE